MSNWPVNRNRTARDLWFSYANSLAPNTRNPSPSDKEPNENSGAPSAGNITTPSRSCKHPSISQTMVGDAASAADAFFGS